MLTSFYIEWRGPQVEAHEFMQALRRGMEIMQKMMADIADER
jgi:hypothetical protein